MRRTRWNIRKAIRALALSFALLAVFTGTASGEVDNAASQPNPEIPYLSHGHGVTGLPFQSAPDEGPNFMNGTPDSIRS